MASVFQSVCSEVSRTDVILKSCRIPPDKEGAISGVSYPLAVLPKGKKLQLLPSGKGHLLRGLLAILEAKKKKKPGGFQGIISM